MRLYHTDWAHNLTAERRSIPHPVQSSPSRPLLSSPTTDAMADRHWRRRHCRRCRGKPAKQRPLHCQRLCSTFKQDGRNERKRERPPPFFPFSSFPSCSAASSNLNYSSILLFRLSLASSKIIDEDARRCGSTKCHPCHASRPCFLIQPILNGRQTPHPLCNCTDRNKKSRMNVSDSL